MSGYTRWMTCAVVAGLSIAGFSTSTSAYQRTQTCNSFGTYSCKPGESPKPIEWPSRCVRYQLNERGSSDFSNGDTISDGLRQLVNRAFETWNSPSCTDFTLVEGPLTSNSTVQYKKNVEWDENMNLVVWRDNAWPYASMHAAFALTSVTYSSNTGRIADADIEINTDGYDFAHLSQSRTGETDKVDIANTLTHEVGHFLGLDHADSDEATMYRSAPSGEVKKRTLHQDDIDGLCATYPGNHRSQPCEYPQDFKPPPPETNDDPSNDSSCCSNGGTPFPQGSLLIGLWGFALLRLRRRD